MKYYDWNITQEEPRVLTHVQGSITRVGTRYKPNYEVRANGDVHSDGKRRVRMLRLCRDAKAYVLSKGKIETAA